MNGKPNSIFKQILISFYNLPQCHKWHLIFVVSYMCIRTKLLSATRTHNTAQHSDCRVLGAQRKLSTSPRFQEHHLINGFLEVLMCLPGTQRYKLLCSYSGYLAQINWCRPFVQSTWHTENRRIRPFPWAVSISCWAAQQSGSFFILFFI